MVHAQRLGKFPGQIMRVAQTTVHALTREGWCQMRCIPSQKNPPVLPALGNTSMKRIDPNAAQGLITVGTERRQKPPNKIILNGGTGRFAGIQLKFIPSDPARARQGDTRTSWITEHLGVKATVARSL